VFADGASVAKKNSISSGSGIKGALTPVSKTATSRNLPIDLTRVSKKTSPIAGRLAVGMERLTGKSRRFAQPEGYVQAALGQRATDSAGERRNSAYILQLYTLGLVSSAIEYYSGGVDCKLAKQDLKAPSRP
jgi:hypothetical protein